MSRLGLIVNPTSGKNTGARIGTEALTLLRAAGVDILDLSAADARSAMEQGRAAISAGAVDRIVVAGGDGMVHLGANLCAGTGVPLGIIAAGTGNDIARELGLPVRDAAKAVERILDGGTRVVDVGEAHDARRVRTAGSWASSRPASTPWSTSGPTSGAGPRGRCATTWRSCASCPCSAPSPTCSSSTAPGWRPRRCSSRSATGRPTAAGMKVTPDASFDDGLLDVLVLHKISTAEFLRVFPTVFKGTHTSHPKVQVLRARTVRLEATGIVSYADGERFAPLPMTMEVVPGALTVLA